MLIHLLLELLNSFAAARFFLSLPTGLFGSCVNFSVAALGSILLCGLPTGLFGSRVNFSVAALGCFLLRALPSDLFGSCLTSAVDTYK